MIIRSMYQTKVDSRYLKNIGKPTKTIIMEDYKNSYTKIWCRCSNCGYDWYALPCSQYRSSCPKRCRIDPLKSHQNDTVIYHSDRNDYRTLDGHRIITKDQEYYIDQIDEAAASQLEHDLEDSKIPYSELTDEQINSDSFLYALIIDGEKRFIKIGVTNNLRRRIQEIKRESGFDVYLHAAKPVNYGRAYLMEKVLKKRLKYYRIDPEKWFRGYTECFSLNFQVIDKLMEKKVIHFRKKLPAVNLNGIEIMDVLGWFGGIQIDV